MSVQRRVCIGPWLIISIAPNSLSLTTSLHPQQTHLSVLSIPPTWKKHLCTLLPPPSLFATQIRDYVASTPPLHYGACLLFFREKGLELSSLVGSCQSVHTNVIIGAFSASSFAQKNGLRGRLELAKTTLVLYNGDVGLKTCLDPFLLPAAFLISHCTPERSHDVPQRLGFR